YIPEAEAVHLYNQSAALEPRARQWFEESARRFRERYYGAWFANLLEKLARRIPVKPQEVLEPTPAEGLDLSGLPFPLWIEVSPTRAASPAAAERLEVPPPSGWRLPDEVVERLPPGDLVIQAVDEAGSELLRRSWPHSNSGRA